MAKTKFAPSPTEHKRGYAPTSPPREKGGNQAMNPTPPPSPPKTNK